MYRGLRVGSGLCQLVQVLVAAPQRLDNAGTPYLVVHQKQVPRRTSPIAPTAH